MSRGEDAKARVLLTDYPWLDVEIERSILAAVGAELIVAPAGDEETLASLAAAHQVDAIMTCWAKVTSRVITSSARCSHVARFGIGLDNIDVAFCKSRGILVTNVPDYCLHEVAEHTLALLLGLARKVAWYHAETKAGRYDLKSGGPLRRLTGQTLGIIGFGAIGRQVAQRAIAMGLKVLAHTRRPIDWPGVEFVGFDELLERSDFVSLHVPHTPETERMIDRRALELMRPTAYLINTARGAVVDHAALADALAANRIAGAALDVQTPEPPDLSVAPYNDPRVIVTPHAAFVSVESLVELRTRATTLVADRLRK
jgi:D-3-phosphoglycerate dehydrogenase